MELAGKMKAAGFAVLGQGESGAGWSRERLTVDKTPSDPSKANSAAMKSEKSKATPS
jgi:hypothetical protein